jgi:hypothetical protein
MSPSPPVAATDNDRYRRHLRPPSPLAQLMATTTKSHPPLFVIDGGNGDQCRLQRQSMASLQPTSKMATGWWQRHQTPLHS